MDIELGDGMDGVAATKAIRAFEVDNGIEPSMIFGTQIACIKHS
jgi:hypothetical protein